MGYIIVVSNQAKPLTALMYGWNKYGGANFGLVQESIDAEWDCQSCGLQSSDIPYDFEFAPREFIKICVFCHRLKVSYNIDSFLDLIDLVRAKHSVVEYLSLE